jgi:hypothetical protein
MGATEELEGNALDSGPTYHQRSCVQARADLPINHLGQRGQEDPPGAEL